MRYASLQVETLSSKKLSDCAIEMTISNEIKQLCNWHEEADVESIRMHGTKLAPLALAIDVGVVLLSLLPFNCHCKA